jgi:hypothetical protein
VVALEVKRLTAVNREQDGKRSEAGIRDPIHVKRQFENGETPMRKRKQLGGMHPVVVTG